MNTMESTKQRPESRFAHYPFDLRHALLKRAAGIRFAGRADYWQAPDAQGDAYVCNMAGGQLLLKLADFVEPGKRIYVQLHCLTYRGVPFEMTGVVLWCRQNHGGKGLLAIATLIDDTSREKSASKALAEPSHASTP